MGEIIPAGMPGIDIIPIYLYILVYIGDIYIYHTNTYIPRGGCHAVAETVPSPVPVK